MEISDISDIKISLIFYGKQCLIVIKILNFELQIRQGMAFIY